MTLQLKKVAAIRVEGYPVGQPGPMYLNCPCGAKPPVDYPDGADVTCTCGRRFNAEGWLQLTAYRVKLSDGSDYATSMAANVTLEDARKYFVGQPLEQSDGRTLEAVGVEIAKEVSL